MDLQTNNQLDLESLTDAQREAVQHVNGPLMVLAGPGSGKTRVVTMRVVNMLQQGIPDYNILALTFTNKAANEMRQRLNAIVPGTNVTACTFHSFCARMLRQYAGLVGLSENFSIYDMSDAKKVMKGVIAENDVELNHYSVDELLKEVSSAKQSLVSHEHFDPRKWKPVDAIVAKVYPLYQKSLLSSNAVDFDDLLFHIASLLRDSETVRGTLDDRFKYISVDEYQDTNSAQYEIVRALSMVNQNLAVTGDPDQSIYGWRGANLNNILNFETDYPETHIVRLEQNYRSTQNILHVADVLISHNIKRKEKSLFTANDEGSKVRLVTFPSQKEESRQIAEQIATAVHNGARPRDFAIFYRVNALSRSLEIALRREGIPYQIVKGYEFYQRKEVKDLLAYLQLLVNPQNEVAFERIINVPSRKIGNVTLQKVRTHSRKYGMTMLDAAREARMNESLSKGSATNVLKFIDVYDSLVTVIDEPVEAIMGHVLSETKYREQFDVVANPDDEDRIANIDELINAAREYDDENPDGNLEGFLEQTSLVADIDAWEGEDDRVTMMTLHAAKGLEFPNVFIVALEEGTLPHSRSSDDPDKIEEERRLLFVGVTRAEKELQMSYAMHRLKQGSRSMVCPSRFLMELPRPEMEIVEMPSANQFFDPYAELDPADFEGQIDGGQFEDGIADAQNRDPSEMTAAEQAAAQLLAMGNRPRQKDADDQSVRETKPASAAKPAIAKRSGEQIPFEEFRLGMHVSCDDYGSGEIVALSGSGNKRVATIDFSEHGQIKFRLAYCELYPA